MDFITWQIICLMLFAALCSITWVCLLTQPSEFFGWVPKLFTMHLWKPFRKNGQLPSFFELIEKVLWECSKCNSAWVFLISYFIIFRTPDFMLIPLTMFQILLTDQLTKLFGYDRK